MTLEFSDGLGSVIDDDNHFGVLRKINTMVVLIPRTITRVFPPVFCYPSSEGLVRQGCDLCTCNINHVLYLSSPIHFPLFYCTKIWVFLEKCRKLTLTFSVNDRTVAPGWCNLVLIPGIGDLSGSHPRGWRVSMAGGPPGLQLRITRVKDLFSQIIELSANLTDSS